MYQQSSKFKDSFTWRSEAKKIFFLCKIFWTISQANLKTCLILEMFLACIANNTFFQAALDICFLLPYLLEQTFTSHPVLHEKGFSSPKNIFVVAIKVLTNSNDIGQRSCIIQFKANQKYHNHFSYHFTTVFSSFSVTSTLFWVKIFAGSFFFFPSEKRKFSDFHLVRAFSVLILQF